MSEGETDFDAVVDEVAEAMADPAPMEELEPAVEPVIITPMVQIEEDTDCPFLDCSRNGTMHLHFVGEPQRSVDE